jgi:hypothetical protein
VMASLRSLSTIFPRHIGSSSTSITGSSFEYLFLR